LPYSERRGTAATRLGGRVHAAIVARRARELRELGAERAAAYRDARAGGSADVVVIGAGARREGLTEDFLPVEVDPGVARGSRMRAQLRAKNGRLLATALSPKFQ
jgi:tRNA A37 methylthiotransferase MiaB